MCASSDTGNAAVEMKQGIAVHGEQSVIANIEVSWICWEDHYFGGDYEEGKIWYYRRWKTWI